MPGTIDRKLVLIYSAIVAIISAIIIFIFNKEFYIQQHWIEAIVSIIAIPFMAYMAFAVVLVLLNTLTKYADKIFEISFYVAFAITTIILYTMCQPLSGIEQYYVNIYNDRDSNKCIAGYVDVEYDESGYMPENIYIKNDTPIKITDANGFNEIDLKSRERHLIGTENDKEYYIEFIKVKSNND